MADTLRFGTTSSGLTSDQLSKISFTGFGAAQIDASGYVTPVPEPATILGGILLLGGLAIAERRRLRRLFAAALRF